MNVQCLKCKGRNLCNRPFCPIMTKISSQRKINLSAKQDFFGESPNIFIGKYGYPNINVGILGTEEYNDHDAPLKWSSEEKQIQPIVDLRTALINSSFKTTVKSFNDKLLSLSQEISLAQKPVDTEINLEKKPFFRLSFNQDTMPHGPRVDIKKARLTENPKIPTKVDKVTSDTDLKSVKALEYLYKSNFDEHYLTKILSVGNLGVKKDRRLVPTRWSITAVDDILGKNLITQIKDFKEADYQAYFGGYLGNYYLILVFPYVWSYELFETVVSENISFATDNETCAGRKEYAHQTAGGYYATRLAVLEKLKKIKCQGSILALRFITSEYWAPLGVWVVREATRKALAAQPLNFASKELMLKYAKVFAKKKFGMDLDIILNKSKLLYDMKTQITLKKFF